MPGAPNPRYDLFVTYSRRDNADGRVTQLVERIQSDFSAFAGRPLVPSFDVADIRGMDDWRHRILQWLRQSRPLLACLSPAYLQSEYYQWEFNEYLKHVTAPEEGAGSTGRRPQQTDEGVRHGEKRVGATLAPTLDRLAEAKRPAVHCAAMLPADHIALPWVRALVTERFPEIGSGQGEFLLQP